MADEKEKKRDRSRPSKTMDLIKRANVKEYKRNNYVISRDHVTKERKETLP